MGNDRIYKSRIVATGNFDCTLQMFEQITMLTFSGYISYADFAAVRELYKTIRNIYDICVIDISRVVDFDEALYSMLLSAVAVSRLNGAEFILIANGNSAKRLKCSGLAKLFSIVSSMASLHAKFAREREASL